MAAPQEDKVAYASVYRREGEVLVAACDEDILDKTFEEGDLNIRVSSGFYGKTLVSIQELTKMLSKATVANLTGNRVVEHAVSLGYVDEERVLKISGIKHAQFLYV
jgi:hypothetical protein